MGGLLDLMAPDPNLRRGGLLSPIGYDKNEDWHFTYPKIAIDAAKAFDNLGTAMRLPHGTSPKHPAYKSVFDTAGAVSLPSLLNPARSASTVGMNLWHGGPNKWAAEPGFPQGRPRLDKMGSGEGAQAYGHGFYSAEKRAVADDYNKKLTGMRLSSAKRQLDKSDGDVDAAILKANQEIKRLLSIPDEMLGGNTRMRDGQIRINEEKIQELSKLKQSGEFSEGSLYKIDIPDQDVAKYIDWDAPLSAQSEFIQKSLSGIMEPDFRVYPKGQKQPISQKFETQAEADSFLKSLGDDASVYEVKGSGSAASGAEIYRKLIDIHGSPEKASEFLKSIGIPGTRFLDEQSRIGTQKNPTRNYVTWDQDVLDRAKVLQRNEEIFNQLTKAGIPFT